MDGDNIVINSNVQHDRISSSSDMDQIEPPAKKSKVEADGVDDSQVLKEKGNRLAMFNNQVLFT